MSAFDDLPEPLQDALLMLGRGEARTSASHSGPSRIVFGTVVRAAPIDEGGELVVLDWEKKEVQSTVSIQPQNPAIGEDPNPRGNGRGCRGVRWHDGQILAATYHTLEKYDPQLRKRGEINGKLMAGLHEIDLTDRNSVWVSSTAIDAAIEYDLETGDQRQTLWPREMPGLQNALGLRPLSIDKSADNRLRFLDPESTDPDSHLHLNAVAEHEETVYALCNEYGAIVDLTNDRIVLQEDELQGGHNLKITEGGVAIANDTYGRAVQLFRLDTGERIRRIELTQYQWVRDLIRWQIPNYWGRELATRTGLMEDAVARPLFVRGLVPYEDTLLIGVSPASILQIDLATGELVDAYQYSADVHVCIHGLDVMEGIGAGSA